MNTGLKLCVVGICAVASLASTSLADLVDMRFAGTGRGRNVQVTLGERTFGTFAGQLRHVFSNGTGAAAGLTGELVTYCTDLSQYVSSNTSTYTMLPVASAPAGGAMGIEKARAVGSLYGYALDAQLTSSTSDDLATAFQLAIWEIVTDYNYALGPSSLSLDSGSFRATRTNGTAIWSSVNNILSSFFANTENTSFALSELGAVTSGRFQDQIVLIPSPGTGLLAACGLVMIGRRRRG